jgi:2-dehydro-3-deoxyphosphogluconate aldolase / (4S)-4-hydroxy-2-oxoglutarate aldolase
MYLTMANSAAPDSASAITTAIRARRIVPVIALERADQTVPLLSALAAGGLEVAEITFRTAAAREALAIAAKEFPRFALGAGTVTTPAEVEAAAAAGARFAVAPGCNPTIVRAAQAAGLPFFPGVCTPSDIERALELGCTTLKFFPAAQAGGTAMIKALYAPYQHRGIQFIPTGGIEKTSMPEYLATPGVLAIGGSWIVANALVKAGNWAEITRLTAEAVAAAAQV